VAIHLEMMHDSRIVPIGSREPLSSNIRMRLGSSRGQWEGDTLVVTTTNFKDRGRIQGGQGGRQTTSTTTLTEKFTRVADDTLKVRSHLQRPGNIHQVVDRGPVLDG
jgi:hypothetical protein